MSLAPVKVPRELLAVQQTALEEYVRNRLLQFIRGFGTRILQLAPDLAPTLIDRAVRDVLEVLPQPDYGVVPVEMLELQLVFRHDCLALGCNEPQCVLCQHNSQRRCAVNFCKKYLVHDRMVARCGAGIRVEVVDRASGKVYDGELPDVFLELFVLDGAQYDTRFLGETGRALLAAGGEAADNEIEECTLLHNNKGAPLITSLTGCRADDEGRLLLQTQGGRLVLPDVTVTDSSEALLSGRKPPFRLVARAKHSDGRRLRIRHAVSEPFVVATRRVRASHKVEIPGMDDAVSKLDHMGRETVRKLADLGAAAAQAGISLGLEPELQHIDKVGEFKALALRADGDGHLRQQLQALLKLPKDKWEEAAEHAKRAVVPDNRMRAWYADPSSLELGLLFPCRLGLVDLKRPEALLQRAVDAKGAFKVEVVVQLRQSPMQRDAVRQLLPQAEASWWAPGHIGWSIFPADTDEFEASSRMAALPEFDFPAAFGVPDTTPHFNAAAYTVQDIDMAAALDPAAAAAVAAPAAAGSHSTGHAAAAGSAGVSGQPRVASSAEHQGLSPAAAAAAGDAHPIVPASVDQLQPAAAAAAAAAGGGGGGQLQGLLVGNITALLQSALPEDGVAAPAAAAADAQAQQAAAHSDQQQQQQHALGPQNPLSLPSAEQLLAMMHNHSLTEGVIGQIAAAYDAHECPSEILNVLRIHIAEDPAAAAAVCAAVAAAAAATGEGTTVQDDGTASSGGGSSSSAGANAAGRAAAAAAATATSPTAGVKRRLSAAAFSHSPGDDFTGENDVAAPSAAAPSPFASSAGTGNAAAAAAADAQCIRSSARVALGTKRPASFSGAINSGVLRASLVEKAAGAAMRHQDDADADVFDAAQELAANRRPASFSGAHSRSLLQRVQELPTQCTPAAAAAADEGDDGADPRFFYQQVKRESSEADLQAAAAEAAAAIAAAAEAVAAQFKPATPQAAAAAAAAPAGPEDMPEGLGPGQSLDVPGLCTAYPSVLLDALVASAAAAIARSPETSPDTPAAAAAAAALTGDCFSGGAEVKPRAGSRSGSGAGSNSGGVPASSSAELEAMLGDSAGKAQLALESLSSLGLDDCRAPAAAAAAAAAKQVTAGSSAAAGDRDAAGLSLRKVDSSLLKPAMSLERMEGMSMELPGNLMQLNSSLLFGNGERSGLLPPLPVSMFSARTSGQATPVGDASLQMPKAMSLELLPSGLLLQTYSGLLQELDAASERDANQRAGIPAGAGFGAGVGGKEGGSGGAVWGRLTAGSSGDLAVPSSGDTNAQRDAAAAGGGSGGCAGLTVRRSGLIDTSMDVGQALDEIMSAADFQ